MATITDAQYNFISSSIYREGEGKEEMRSLSHLPTKIQFRAVFQAIEGWWEGEQAGLKAVIDAAYGQTTSVALARKILKAWILMKMGVL